MLYSFAMAAIRLQKHLAQCGIASRRASEKIIAAGRVQVNGTTITTQGISVDPERDIITVDGTPAQSEENLVTIIIYKPRGYICSTDSTQGRTVLDLIDGQFKERIYPVGRLDKESEGLLLLTNDGQLTHRLTHPSHGHTKIYEVTVAGKITDNTIAALNSPMLIDGYRTFPASVKIISGDNSDHKLQFILTEGRNRQIRKMCEAVGLQVKQLKRTRIQSLTLDGLRPGQWRKLRPDEIEKLLLEK